MHARLLIALLVALTLLLGACTDDDDPGDGSAEDAAPEEEPDPEELDLGAPPELSDPVDLEDGVAATVNGTEIESELVEERFQAVADLPEFSEQLERQEDEARAAIQSQILGNLIVQQIIADGAQDLGVEPSDEEVQAAEDEAAEQFEGGREAFEEALEAEDVSQEQREQEFRFVVRIDAIRDDLESNLDVDDLDLGEEGEELGIEPADIAFQEWFAERLESTEVQVDQEYGAWSPQEAQVVPLG